MSITKLVIIRHGESQWNIENRFTGWTDIELSQKGWVEAKNSGKILKEKGFKFDIAFTSMLKRSIHTLWNILDELDQVWIPIEKSWRLNERHYGALQGLDKYETSKQYGDEQVKKWRRYFFSTPPQLDRSDQRFPGHDSRYSNLSLNELPTTESLALTMNRLLPYWKDNIIPRIERGKRIIIATHGNTIRALMKFLDNLSEEKIIELNIPTGVPLIYEFDKNIKPVNHFYLQ